MTEITTNYTVCGIGEVLWDVFPDGKRLGGAPANFAYQALCLGCQSSIISAVGNDASGREILELVSEYGIGTDYVQTGTNKTGKVLVTMESGGSHSFDIVENSAWDCIEENNSACEFLQQIDAVCYGSLAFRSERNRCTLLSYLKQLPKGCLAVCDLNLRQSYYSEELIGELLEYADVLKINDDEFGFLQSLFGLPDNELEGLHTITERWNLTGIALTKGEGGSSLLFDGDYAEADACIVDVVDTVGAGDAYTAALTVGLLGGFSLNKLINFCSKVSAMACTQRGAMTQYTPMFKAELLKYISGQSQTLELC